MTKNQSQCVLIGLALGAGLMAGCPAGPGGMSGTSAPGEKTLDSMSWTLDDGTALKAAFVARPIDEYSSLTSMVVTHTYDAASQSPLESVAIRHPDADNPEKLAQMWQLEAETTDGRTAQTFEVHMSAPGMVSVEFVLTKNGTELQPPIAWTARWADGPGDAAE
jgi:hypothetical protein